LYPVRVTRRVNDEVRYKQPVWRVPVPPDVAGRLVAVVDEMADTGETLAMLANQVRAQGATRVVTATLVSHSIRHVPMSAFTPRDRQKTETVYYHSGGRYFRKCLLKALSNEYKPLEVVSWISSSTMTSTGWGKTTRMKDEGHLCLRVVQA
jgi:hypoxanthine phosphoribosyltransferase